MTEPVDIEFRINDRELEQSSKRAVDSILGINSAGEQTVKTLRLQIADQKQLIRSIDKDITDITKKLNKAITPQHAANMSGDLKYAKRALDE